MKYENYDEYINNPLSKNDIENIILEINNIEIKLQKYFKTHCIFFGFCALASLLFTIFSIFFFSNNVLFISSILCTLIVSFRLLDDPRILKEIKLVKEINDNCKVEVRSGYKNEFYDYLCKSSGYRIAGIKRRLQKNTELDKYHFKEDYDNLLSNIKDRDLLDIDYSIISDKYRSLKYKK